MPLLLDLLVAEGTITGELEWDGIEAEAVAEGYFELVAAQLWARSDGWSHKPDSRACSRTREKPAVDGTGVQGAVYKAAPSLRGQARRKGALE